MEARGGVSETERAKERERKRGGQHASVRWREKERARERTRTGSYREVSRARRTFRPTVVESSVARVAESDSREPVTRVGCRYLELRRGTRRVLRIGLEEVTFHIEGTMNI